MRSKTVGLMVIVAAAFTPLTLSTPVAAQEKAMTNKDWWPDHLDLSPLR